MAAWFSVKPIQPAGPNLKNYDVYNSIPASNQIQLERRGRYAFLHVCLKF